jgi:hypothetical protein
MLSYLGRIRSTDYLLKALFSSPQGIRKLFNVLADITNKALFCFSLRLVRIKPLLRF